MDMDGYGPFPQKMNTIIVNGCFVWGVRFRRRDLSSRLLLQTQHIAWDIQSQGSCRQTNQCADSPSLSWDGHAISTRV